VEAGRAAPLIWDLWPYLCRPATPKMASMVVDPFLVLLTVIGVSVAVALAVIAGTITARVFFDATREPETEEKI